MRLTPHRYRELVAEDAALLVSAARLGLDAPVPPCPGWVVRDVVGHTGAVHRQKEAILRLRVGTREETPDLEEPPGDDALIDWFEEGVEKMLTTLDVPSDIPVYTWYSADQTSGFWQRRMAHETVIHRADAQSAHGEITPIDTALAIDGIDEILGPIMCGYTADPSWEFSADRRLVTLWTSDADIAFSLVMGSGKYGPGWILLEGEAADPITIVTGTASDLDLWAWGRVSIDALTVEGDPGPTDEIRQLAAEATQ